jgi:hypothetical protein
MRTRSATSVPRAGSRRGSLPEIRPAAILFMPSRPDLAAVVEQALADVLPNCMRPEQLHRVEPLDLDTAEASIALDPEQFAGDLGKPPLLDGQPWLPGGARVAEDGVPILGGNSPSGGGSLILEVRSGLLASFSICLGIGIRQDAGWWPSLN